MLKVALQLEKAFIELGIIDSKYCQELESGSDILTPLDWKKARKVAQFLRSF